MKKLITILLLALCMTGLIGCSSKEKRIIIAIPNDTSNEARALLLLQANGIIEIDEKAGITATIQDIVSNPFNIEFKEVEAAQIPNVLPDVDYAVINGNYAIDAGLSPTKDALLIEGSASAYVNILCAKQGNENNPLVKALAAALLSDQVKQYIAQEYTDGSVVSVCENPSDGYDASIDYAALAGKSISCAASPAPHCGILEIAKKILSEKNIELKIYEYTDYVQPNVVVEQGQVDTNFFQHVPYLEEFNAQKDTHIVSVAGVHVEPMCLYGGKQKNLDSIK